MMFNFYRRGHAYQELPITSEKQLPVPRTECSVAETYQNVDGFVEGLHQHRTQLLCDATVAAAAPAKVITKIRCEGGVDGIYELINLASSEHQIELRKALRDFAERTPTLSWTLRGHRPPVQGSSQAALFSRPPVCEGRGELIDEIEAIVMGRHSDESELAPRTTILHGIGGIGKSAVALELLHRPKVVARFADRRFFVRCDDITTCDALMNHLVTQLAVEASGKSPMTALCDFAVSASAVVVLDNFEGLCPGNVPAAGVEDFLAKLSEGSDGANGLFMIVTKRGNSNIHLRRARSYAVKELSLEVASLAFIRHARRESVKAGPALRELVERLDGHPLAIRLLARRFDLDGLDTVEQLLAACEKWRDDPPGAYSLDRRNSIATSIEISLLGPTMLEPGASDLCLLVCLLPDGVEDELIENFLDLRRKRLGSTELIDGKARGAVIGSGLAEKTPQGLVRMLAPLREYISSKKAVGDELRRDARSAIQQHTDRLLRCADSLFDQSSAKESAALRERVTSQLGNLRLSICESLGSQDSAECRHGIRQSAQLARFVFDTVPIVPSFLAVAIDKALQIGFAEGAADCLQLRGMIEHFHGVLTQASATMEQAWDLQSKLDIPQKAGDLLKEWAHLAMQTGELSFARELLEYARDLHQEANDPLGEATTLQRLSDLAFKEALWPTARMHLDDALDIQSRLNHTHGRAGTLDRLGRLAFLEGDIAIAREFLLEAWPLHVKTGDRRGEGNCLERLGDIALQEDKFDAALSYHQDALRVRRETHDILGTANSFRSLGCRGILLNDLPAARYLLEDARRLYQQVNAKTEEAHTVDALARVVVQEGDVFRMRRTRFNAKAYLEEALGLYEETSNTQEARQCHYVIELIESIGGCIWIALPGWAKVRIIKDPLLIKICKK